MIFNLSSRFLALAAAATLAFTSCTEEGDQVTVNVPGSKQNATVTYVVQAMDASGEGTSGLTGAIQGATLRYFNANTNSYTTVSTATNADGVISIQGVRPGTFSGIISAPGYSTINFVSDITQDGVDTVYTAVSRIHMFKNSAELTGRVYGNYSLTQATPNPTNPSDVREVDLRLTYQLRKTGENAYPMGSGPGRLVDVRLEPSVFAIQQSNNSSFTADQLYSTESGLLMATLSMVPKQVTSGSNSAVFTLAGNPRNEIPVKLYANQVTNLGNLLTNGQ